MFELNFRDERYLPCEGAGTISRWRIELPKDTNAFDFDALTDVVLHLKYTAREGGELLRNAARTALHTPSDAQNVPLVRLFSLKHEFPTEWCRFLNPAQGTGDHEQAFALSKDRFPFLFQSRDITIDKLDLFVVPQAGISDMTELDGESTRRGSPSERWCASG